MSASYPGAVKAFASRSNGQTIDASHVGDLQDEVSAIEAGITQGTAPLNSSNSTLLNLSVSAKSTFVGNVQMNGNCTVTGSLTAGPLRSPPRSRRMRSRAARWSKSRRRVCRTSRGPR
jgi:hypothetical protein